MSKLWHRGRLMLALGVMSYLVLLGFLSHRANKAASAATHPTPRGSH